MVMYVDSKASSKHPVVLTAHLDPGLSRWRSLVKWFLAIPHYFLLAFLWPALMTDQYPPFRLDQGGTEPTLPPAVDPAIPLAPDPAGTRTAS